MNPIRHLRRMAGVLARASFRLAGARHGRTRRVRRGTSDPGTSGLRHARSTGLPRSAAWAAAAGAGPRRRGGRNARLAAWRLMAVSGAALIAAITAVLDRGGLGRDRKPAAVAA